MTRRKTGQSSADGNPYPNSTPRECALMILWIVVHDAAHNPEIPKGWALGDPKRIGLSEDTQIRTGGNSKYALSLNDRISLLAHAQDWEPNGDYGPVPDGTTFKKILDHYGVR